MKKNNRDPYLKAWLTYLKGKNQIDPKALADFLGKTLKGALSPITRKRYTATVIANLYENGFLAGKTGKTFSGESLEIVREISLPVLDKSLTHNYKKVKFTDLDQPAEPIRPVTEARAAKKPRKTGKKKEAPKPVRAKAGKPVGRKADLVKRGEEAFLFATRQQEQIEEMERVIANYERMFEAIRQLFSREIEEIEEWLGVVLK